MQDQQFNFVDTSATRKIFDLHKRIRAVAGGTSASKTISILIWLIDYCQSPKNHHKLCTVTSESYPHLLGGAIEDFQNIMKDRGYWNEDRWVRNPKTVYTFETGNRLEFATFDTYSKAHGSRRDVLFVNEGNNMPYNIVDQLMVRTRETVWLDWNPTNEFWFYTNILNLRDDVDFITLTYKDNEALDELTIKEIESHKENKQWWTVYGLGQLGTLEGRVYSNWVEIDEVPVDGRLERRGLDFGYTNDPSVLVDAYKWNDAFVLDEIFYQKGLSNKSIADIILSQREKALSIGDSAEPKSIAEISDCGVQIIGAVKGPDSVMQGIEFVKAQKIYITKRSIKTIKAYRNYMFMKDKLTDKFINKPDDTIHEWSNPMDAVRYALDSYRERKKFTQPTTFGGVAPYIESIG